MHRDVRSPLTCYGIAAASVVIAMIVRALLDPILGERVPLMIFTLCVGISAYWGGLGPGLLATVLGGVLGAYFFMEIRSTPNLVGTAIYLLNGLMISFLSEALHVSRRKAESSMRDKERESAERHRIEEERIREAQQASRLKDEFLSTISHELRTPLNAIVGWLHLLKSGRLDEADRQRAFDTIYRNVGLQTKLVGDMLDASRIITGKLKIERRPVDLAQAIHTAAESVRATAEAKSISLNLNLEICEGELLGDSDRLQQVLWNLLFNSIKFTPREGRVDISLKKIDECAQINVVDTGIGIKPDFLPYVFDQFRQADSSITRAYGGMGLGLTIVRYLVELHGGSISAESEGENLGATFIIKLPYKVKATSDILEAFPLSVNDSRFRAEEARLAGLRILLVDDEPDTLEVMSLLLAKRGAEVKPVSSAAEAINTLRVWTPNVLVADIAMPVEDGYALIGKVRAMQPEQGSLIPALALTAYSEAEDRDRAMAAGFQKYLSKPVEPDELTRVIAELAGLPTLLASRPARMD